MVPFESKCWTHCVITYMILVSSDSCGTECVVQFTVLRTWFQMISESSNRFCRFCNLCLATPGLFFSVELGLYIQSGWMDGAQEQQRVLQSTLGEGLKARKSGVGISDPQVHRSLGACECLWFLFPVTTRYRKMDRNTSLDPISWTRAHDHPWPMDPKQPSCCVNVALLPTHRSVCVSLICLSRPKLKLHQFIQQLKLLILFFRRFGWTWLTI